MFDRRIATHLASHFAERSFVVEDADHEMRAFAAQPRGALRRSAQWNRVWGLRGEVLEAECRKFGGSGVLQALARRAIHEGRLGDATTLLEQCDDQLRSAPALRALRLHLLCLTNPEGVLAALEAEGNAGILEIADVRLLLDVALALEKSERIKVARKVLDRLPIAKTEMPDVLAEIAQLSWRVGDEPKAIAAAEKALSAMGHCVPALNVLGAAHARRGEHEAALSYLERALTEDPLHRPALINDLSLRTHYLGIEIDFGRLEAYIRAYPSDLALAQRVCTYAAQADRWREALDIWRLVEGHIPNDDYSLRTQIVGAEACLKLGRTTDAADLSADVEKRLTPDVPDAVLEYALLTVSHAGRGGLVNVLRRNPEWLTGTAWLGQALRGVEAFLQDDHEASVKFLSQAHHLAPRELGVSRLLLHALFDRGLTYDEPADLACMIVRQDPTALGDWGNAIYGLLMADRLKDATGAWNRICRRPAWRKALDTVFYYRATHGLLEIKEGNIERGLLEYQVAENIAPDDKAKARVRQKGQLEGGRAFLRARQPAQGLPLLESARRGPDTTFSREALRLIDPTARV